MRRIGPAEYPKSLVAPSTTIATRPRLTRSPSTKTLTMKSTQSCPRVLYPMP